MKRNERKLFHKLKLAIEKRRPTNDHIVFQFDVCRRCVVHKVPFEYIERVEGAQKHRECKHTEKVKQKSEKFVNKIAKHFEKDYQGNRIHDPIQMVANHFTDDATESFRFLCSERSWCDNSIEVMCKRYKTKCQINVSWFIVHVLPLYRVPLCLRPE